MYERSDYVGGRSTVIWPWNDEPTRPAARSTAFTSEWFASDDDAEAEEDPVELGAAIFVAANKNLEKVSPPPLPPALSPRVPRTYPTDSKPTSLATPLSQAATVFGLEKVAQGTSGSDEAGTMAIFDGERLVFTESEGWGWWDLGRLFWRYGRAPLRARALVKATVQSFLDIYGQGFASYGPFESWTELARAVNLTHAAALTGADFLRSKEVSAGFVNELVAAATQVNYGTPVHEIHGLGALVSLAASGASAIEGGNRRLFEEFVGRSGAAVRLNATVEALARLDPSGPGKRARWQVQSSAGNDTFDAVILAAPFHQTGIRLAHSGAAARVPEQAYVPLVVTFVLTSSAQPRPEYFGLKPGARTPTSVFATFDTASAAKPAFNSLSYLKQLSAAVAERLTDRLRDEGGDWPAGTEWHVVKLFSSASLSDALLEDVFGAGAVGKTVEKEWLAYPRLEPVTWAGDVAEVRLDEGLYYVNGFERFISTMETSTVAAFNVVSLLLSDLFGYSAPASWAEWDVGEV